MTRNIKKNQKENKLHSAAQTSMEHLVLCFVILKDKSFFFSFGNVQLYMVLTLFNLDRVRKMYKGFPNIPIPEHLEDDDDMQKLSEALVAAKVRVEGCLSFLRSAIK